MKRVSLEEFRVIQKKIRDKLCLTSADTKFACFRFDEFSFALDLFSLFKGNYKVVYKLFFQSLPYCSTYNHSFIRIDSNKINVFYEILNNFNLRKFISK